MSFSSAELGHKETSETGEQKGGRWGNGGRGGGGGRPEITHFSRESHLSKLLGNDLISTHIVPLRETNQY